MQVVCAAGPREAAARPMLNREAVLRRRFFASGARGFGAVGVGVLSALFQAE